jgi:effector-binding domain-containing protein
MAYEIVVETAPAVPIAAVRRRLRPAELSTAWRPALDQVWTFLRQRDGLWRGGHNIFVYQAVPRGDALEVAFGVEVAGPFDSDGEVQLARTPAGTVASTLHVGPIDGLGAAYAAIEAWRSAAGRTFAGTWWETYGDWTDDPAANEVRVTYLLAAADAETR